MKRNLLQRIFSVPICASCRAQIGTRLPLTRAITSTAHQRSPSPPTPSTARGAADADAGGDASAAKARDSIMADLAKLLQGVRGPGQTPVGDPLGTPRPPPIIHRLHVYATKHNTHITLTRPDMERAGAPKAIMSLSAGNLGFKKAARGTYDAAHQVIALVLGRIQGEGLLGEIKELEVVMRGFGMGREAVQKAIMGNEGRMIRPKITALKDATRLKFGGTRSPKPRRLG